MDVPYADHLYGGVGVPAAVTGLRRACARARVCVCVQRALHTSLMFSQAVFTRLAHTELNQSHGHSKQPRPFEAFLG